MVRFEVVEVPERRVATLRRVVQMAELPGFFASTFGVVAAAVEAGGGAIAGPPFGWYHGSPGETVDVAAGFPVEGWDGGGGEVRVWQRRGGPAVLAIHVGPYDAMAETYAALRDWCTKRSVTLADDMWEEYLTGPEADPSTWQTRIVWPLDEPDERAAAEQE